MALQRARRISRILVTTVGCWLLCLHCGVIRVHAQVPSVAGDWDSEWGTVTLTQTDSAVTGYVTRDGRRTIEFTEGRIEAGQLILRYRWGEAQGAATFALSRFSLRWEGSYRHESGERGGWNLWNQRPSSTLSEIPPATPSGKTIPTNPPPPITPVPPPESPPATPPPTTPPATTPSVPPNSPESMPSSALPGLPDLPLPADGTCATFQGLRPGVSTRADVGKLLGEPLSTTGELVEYRPRPGTGPIGVEYRSGDIADRLEVFFLGIINRAELLSSLKLPNEPAASTVSSGQSLVEYFTSPCLTLTYSWTDRESGVRSLGYHSRSLFDQRAAAAQIRP